MSGVENFLARWSRRKRQAAAQQAAKRDSSSDAEGDAPPDAAAPETPAPENSLPPIESINAATDLKPFLASGVPANLARAALRRAWTADPAVRDFVGLSENAWDFNAPGGVPGFGALTREELDRLVAALTPEPEPGPAASISAPGSDLQPATEASNAAPQHEERQQETPSAPSTHRHGSALPQ